MLRRLALAAFLEVADGHESLYKWKMYKLRCLGL